MQIMSWQLSIVRLPHHFDTCISLYKPGHTAGQNTVCRIALPAILVSTYTHQRLDHRKHHYSMGIDGNTKGPIDLPDKLRRKRILNQLNKEWNVNLYQEIQIKRSQQRQYNSECQIEIQKKRIKTNRNIRLSYISSNPSRQIHLRTGKHLGQHNSHGNIFA